MRKREVFFETFKSGCFLGWEMGAAHGLNRRKTDSEQDLKISDGVAQ